MTPMTSSTSGGFRLSLSKRIIGGADLTKKSLRKKPSTSTTPKKTATPKTKTPTFSRRSRNNLIKAVNSLSELPQYFVTLSYPDGVSDDPKAWKSDLDNLNRRLRHHYPESWWMWRIEPQSKTGKPHYHIVGSTNVTMERIEFWRWLHDKWCKIVGLDPKKAQFATRVNRVKDGEGRLERYFCKVEGSSYGAYRQGWTDLTNRWGKVNAVKIPFEDLDTYEVGPVTLEKVKELVLGSIQTQVGELQDKLDGMGQFTAYKDRHKMERVIRNKKQHMYDIRYTGDFFSILDPDHINLIRQTLRDRRKAGTIHR
ncbi:rolling circle replication-associated protein [Pseudodesulfovibrio sediminis]|uniref:Replication-associated protein ORF2/G2P domain-containing protein n=1 Tax=Pseudodesulfovibrio sediminis TaxID=2810563 RepID=A0ABN6EQQ9_9BACT|nr:hypothetical protein [Pseudodesulfovibrio sediminis]BCS87133.1 hypothetical protein PSDVSF_03750 [Pseudodesulfovibrio sediminis]